ncbi:ATP-binding protein [Mycobacterium sp. SP-6446]|uniref:ATP-binding protein n=1 Tax=Mycobacterium sp. SP-6446 TaxID=1834162 RepID=UPI00096DFF8A|nr:ATP-binding protein [Mycobacterium sp. SP-6446]OMC19069.1 type IV secretion system protein VirB4 [Mycobacterium sp. SP-6446]
MSLRLGAALAEYLRRHLVEGRPNFVLVEGVPVGVAEGMSGAWDDKLPRLAVVAPNPSRFGSHALGNQSGTHLRNSGGVVVVLCGGEQVPDRQSLNLFESVSPSVLLDTTEGLTILSQQQPAVDLDGPARAVREAIVQSGPAARPSALAVATYLDRLADGKDPLRELPLIGGFADHLPAGERADAQRIADNLALAAKRTADDLLRPSSYADLRHRAERVLSQRPGLKDPVDARRAAADIMGQLQNGSVELLSSLRFDEARQIFEQRSEKLTAVVRREMAQFRAGLVEGSQAEMLPWEEYDRIAGDLSRGTEQRAAAQELCNLDDAQQRQIFTRPTRNKLERLLRDKSVNGSNPSCPEAAIVRAAQQLGGLIERVQVLEPKPPGTGRPTTINRSVAGRILTLACARLRLGGLLHRWSQTGGEVDGLLLRSADDEDLGDVLDAFADAGLSSGATLPPLQLRLHADDGSTVQVDWRPDLDDAAMLRVALLFADEPALAFAQPGEPTLHAFCGGASITALPLPASLTELASALQKTAREALDRGLSPRLLSTWTDAWTNAVCDCERAQDTDSAEALALSGAIVGDQGTALTALAPLKAEWLAQYLEALWQLLRYAEEPVNDTSAGDAVAAALGVARATATHHPAHLRLSTQDRALLPSSEGRIWSVYGGVSTRDESGFAGEALRSVITQLLKLQPEAAGHLRCLAWGPGAADLLVSVAVRLIGTSVGGGTIARIEVFCVGTGEDDRPAWHTLAYADDNLRAQRDVLQLRYLDDLAAARALLSQGNDSPAVHLALVTGLTEGGGRLQIEAPEVPAPGCDSEVLFAPRVWQRPRKDRRTLLMPPAATPSGHAWLRLQNAVEESWPDPDQTLRIPEVRTGTLDIRSQLGEVHDLALWVATLDRYATRDSLEQALGRDNVAILHQERRLGGDSPLSLVLSQKSGGPADRAIGRSLRAAGIVDNRDLALSIGSDLRKVASQGYGILALQAATSGAGINELVGHVVAFSLLATTATPWPLPPGCRVLLVSLDEYQHWFSGKRADLLAIALDPDEGGVHVACIEVKARRSDETDAAAGALDQLSQTLAATRWAAYPEPGSIHTRLWLNRITEAAYAVARESRFKLDAAELAALEAFRLARGSLEWAGVGLIFGPKVKPLHKIQQNPVGTDIVPVALHTIQLTEQLLRTATGTDLTQLRTVETDRPSLQSSRVKRRPEGKKRPQDEPSSEAGRDDRARAEANSDAQTPASPTGEPVIRDDGATTRDEPASIRERGPRASEGPGADKPRPASSPAPALADEEAQQRGSASTTQAEFVPPILGWDATTGQEVRWHPAGLEQTLNNGHLEIWGTSGMGKTQFAMSLLAQLSHYSGSKFGIADFKNDYSDETGFPRFAGADFLDLWDTGAPYNPLALTVESPRAIDTAVIELRDTVDEAARAFVRMGHRQKQKLEKALHEAYAIGREEERWPTLRTLDDQLDADLAGVMGDLTRYELFKSGPPLGDVVDRNVVFGLSKIPGNGQTTVLAAGFILSALLLRIQSLPPVPNTIRYLAVVDEAHRVAEFRAIQTMIREGRSKGLGVVLATQQPLDLHPVVAANAQTKICFGISDATAAAMAARRLDPGDRRLPEQIRTLGKGEAYVSLGGDIPRLTRMTQAYRDHEPLGLPPLHPSL